MSGVNKTKFLVQHESQEYKCGLNETVCNSKQKWNHDECWCECKELDDSSSCKYHYMWILVRVILNITRHVKLANI